MREMQLFVPLLKVDAETRQVWGIAALEVPDKYGEIFDYTTSKPYVEAWSNEISMATDGQSLGNVRAMHGKVAAGKLIEMNFNDGERQIEVCAKIVDDNEWAKVEQGVYTGFSIGGGYVKKWDNGDGLKRYTAKPVEVSIVDNPAMPGANFTMFKAAGMAETRPFATYEPGDGERNTMTIPNEAVVAHAKELAKAAGASSYADFIGQARTELEKAAKPAEDDAAKKAADEAAAKKAADDAAEKAAEGEEGGTAEKAATPTNVDPRNKVKQGWQAEDGSFHLSKAAALSHNDALAKAAADEAANKVQNTMASAESLLNRIEKGAVIAKATDEGRDPLDKPEDAEDEDADKAAKAKGAKDKAEGDDKKPAFLGKFSTADDLQKGMWEVSRLANLIEELDWLHKSCCFEAETEKDNSTVPAMLKKQIAALGATLRAMVDEEISEMVAKGTFTADLLKGAGLGVAGLNRLTNVLGARLEKSATDDTANKVITEALEKATKSVDVEKMQTLHDHACEMGAKCAGMAKGAGLRADDPMEGGLLQKGMELLSAENGELREQLNKAVGLLGSLSTKVETLLAQPVVSLPSRLSVVEKGVDTGGTAPGGGSQVDLSKMDPNTLAAAAIRMSQATGGHRFFPGATQGT